MAIEIQRKRNLFLLITLACMMLAIISTLVLEIRMSGMDSWWSLTIAYEYMITFCPKQTCRTMFHGGPWFVIWKNTYEGGGDAHWIPLDQEMSAKEIVGPIALNLKPAHMARVSGGEQRSTRIVHSAFIIHDQSSPETNHLS